MKSEGRARAKAMPGTAPQGRAELLYQVMVGDDSALVELIICVDPLLRSIVGRYRLDAADRHDVLQTVWVRFLEHRHTIRRPERAIAWLRTTARRESMRALARRCRERPCAMGVVDMPAMRWTSPEECAVRTERARSVWRAAGRLSDRDRTLAVLIAHDAEISYAALAERIGVVENSVGQVRGRCFARMRRLLAEDGIVDAS